MKKNVLFICVQNSARSQIAAALLNETCGDYFEAQSAGLEPGVLNPLAVEALQETRNRHFPQPDPIRFRCVVVRALHIRVCDYSMQ